MNWLPDQNIDNVIPISVATHDGFGAMVDADSAPTYRVYEMATDTPILTGTLSALDAANTDGFYNGSITASAANGFEVGKTYRILVRATVASIIGGQVTLFRMVETLQDQLSTFFEGNTNPQLDRIESAVITSTTYIPVSNDTIDVNVSGSLSSLRELDGVPYILTAGGSADALQCVLAFDLPTGAEVLSCTMRAKAVLGGQGYSGVVVKAYNWETQDEDTVASFTSFSYTTKSINLTEDHVSNTGVVNFILIGQEVASLLDGIHIDQFVIEVGDTIAGVVDAINTVVTSPKTVVINIPS